MSPVLKLDLPSMNALFPEGSTARVDLQNAVLASFIRQSLKPSWVGAMVTDQIKAAQDAAVRAVLNELGIVTYSSVALPEALKLKFKTLAKEAVADAVAPLIKDAVVERTATLASGVLFEVTRKVNERVEAEINAAVRAKVLSALTAATGG